MAMSKPSWVEELNLLNACTDAVTWVKGYPDLASAWQACERGDWMLWLAGRYSGNPGSERRRTLVLAACECARLSLHHVPAGEGLPLRAIEVGESWARRKAGITLDDVHAAAAAATAWAAAWAEAASAEAAAWAEAASAEAATGAWDAAAAAATATARTHTLRKCADIVRKHYPNPPQEAPCPA